MKRNFLLLFFISVVIVNAQEPEIKRAELKVLSPTPERKGISWSPKGEKVKFSAKRPAGLYKKNKAVINKLIDPVFGFITVGGTAHNKIYFSLSKKTKESGYRERLIIDSDNNGVFDAAKETYDAEAKDVRGKMWVSHNSVLLNVKFKKKSVRHIINIWHVYPKPGEEGEFDVIRYSRGSWMEGKLNYEGKEYRIAMIDADNTLSFTMEDVWTILEENENTNIEISKSFGVPLNKPAFIGEQAFRLTNYNEAGTIADIKKTNDIKEIVKKEPEAIREKAVKSLNWIHTFNEALAKAKKENKKLFVKWWAEWCGPCKELENTTLKDKIIVDLLEKDYLVTSIDHDKEYLIAQKQNVKLLPTIQFFDAKGKEIKRFTGFLTAAELEIILKEIK